MVGIEALSMYVPPFALSMEQLAADIGVDPEKCLKGIGQRTMAVPPPDEDCVTMAASAALPLLKDVDLSSIAAVVVATESGVDQSKAASIWIHRLLNLPSSCLCWEVKQACCGSTMAVLNALDFVSRRPDKKVLVIASDIAVYEPGTPGELTQGAGAVAILLSCTPSLLEIGPELAAYTIDVMDFWRPNYLRTARVDGRLSIKVYLKALSHCWSGFIARNAALANTISRFCFHQPFTRMADKALNSLRRFRDAAYPSDAIAATQHYNREIGNTYTASMFIGLCSLLESDSENLSRQHIGLFGYGSGAVAALYAGTVSDGYKNHLRTNAHQSMLAGRTHIDYKTYREFMDYTLPVDGSKQVIPRYTVGSFRLAGVVDHKRCYEPT